MGLSLDDEIKMEAYFNGALNKADEQAFLLKVAADKELQETFEFEKFLRGKTNTIPEAEIATIIKLAKPKPWKYLIAASVIGLIVITGILIYNNSNKPRSTGITKNKVANKDSDLINESSTTDLHPSEINPQLIYKNNYTAYEPTGNEPPELGKTMLAYNAHDYDKTLSELNNIGILRGGNENAELEDYKFLYKGLCFAETNKTSSAVETFSGLLASAKNDDVKAAAQWYLSLQLIKQNNMQHAIELLTSLSAGKSSYNKKASALLKQIDKS